MSQPMEPLSAEEVEKRYQDAKQYVGITKTTICELCESHERLRAKLDWLPIETAPKDGTCVDLWCAEMLRLTNFRWYDEDNSWQNQWGELFKSLITPTHWMPIPAPPKEIA